MYLTESTLQLSDGDGTFAVTLIEAEDPAGVVFFAAGRGGSPLRHLGLIRAVAKQGYTVVAPHFEMLPLSAPTQDDLNTRIRRLNLALQQYATASQPIFGIGHSLGCVVLLVLAGAIARTRLGDEVTLSHPWNFDKLVLLVPAVDFFRHPDASLNIDARIHLRAGNQDTIVTPDHVLALKDLLPEPSKVKFYLDEDAGHFSYMDELPPNVEDSQPNRQTFLSVLTEEVGAFISSKP